MMTNNGKVPSAFPISMRILRERNHVAEGRQLEMHVI